MCKWILFAFLNFGIVEEITAKQTEIAVAIVWTLTIATIEAQSFYEDIVYHINSIIHILITLLPNFYSKLLSDLYIGVHLKGTKKFGSRFINRQFFYRKAVFLKKYCLLLTLLPNFLLSKTTS